MKLNLCQCVHAIILFSFLSSLSYANEKIIVDVYGTNKINHQQLLEKYSMTIKNFYASLNTSHSQKKLTDVERKYRDMLHWLNRQGDFAVMETSVITYPDKNGIFFSVDVVEKGDEKRLSYFNPAPTKALPDPDKLIATWRTYEAIGFHMVQDLHRFPKPVTHCPAFHCVWGFEAPEFKKYEPIFTRLVPKHKEELITILHKDKHPENRAAAAYLLAHIHNPDVLIQALLPAIRDNSSVVRNSVLRVLGELFLRYEPKAFPIDELVMALDFPINTDRNKAVFTLDSLSKYKSFQGTIRQKAGVQLVKLLQSKQPNIHNFAYAILNRLSDKHYPASDDKHWQAWARAVSRQSSHESTASS